MGCFGGWEIIFGEGGFINFLRVFKRLFEGVCLIGIWILGVFCVCKFLIYLDKSFIDCVGFILILLLIVGCEFFFFRFFFVFLFLVVFLDLVVFWCKFGGVLKEDNFLVFLVFGGICGWIFLEIFFGLGLLLGG